MKKFYKTIICTALCFFSAFASAKAVLTAEQQAEEDAEIFSIKYSSLSPRQGGTFDFSGLQQWKLDVLIHQEILKESHGRSCAIKFLLDLAFKINPCSMPFYPNDFSISFDPTLGEAGSIVVIFYPLIPNTLVPFAVII